MTTRIQLQINWAVEESERGGPADFEARVLASIQGYLLPEMPLLLI